MAGKSVLLYLVMVALVLVIAQSPPAAVSTPDMATETAGALLAVINHILTPAMLSNESHNISGMLVVRKCPNGFHNVPGSEDCFANALE